MQDVNSGKFFFYGKHHASSGEKFENRRLVIWEFQVPVKKYYLRDNFNTYQEYIPILIGVVHTSPSGDLEKEINRILESMKKISTEKNMPILVGGDWYMQNLKNKTVKKIWENLQKGIHWHLIAPNCNTNYPGKMKKGQIADHFVASKNIFLVDNILAISHKQILIHEDEKEYTQKGTEELEEWTDIKIDHTPVYTAVSIDLQEISSAYQEKAKKGEMMKTPINGTFDHQVDNMMQKYKSCATEYSFIRDGEKNIYSRPILR